MKARFLSGILILLLVPGWIYAQAGGHTLWGDLLVDESKITTTKAATFTVLLYSEGGPVQMRQTVLSNGRYRFLDLKNGRYEVAVEYENVEIMRITVSVQAPFRTDFRRDIELQWTGGPTINRVGVISADDYFARPSANKELFKKAIEASGKKSYEKAVGYLKQIVTTDAADYSAWQELGTVLFILKNFTESESAYSKALQAKPDYETALINLGRLRIAAKNYTGAIEVLDRAVKIDPKSALANYFLGEAYLQSRLGSKAVPYLNEAIRLDPKAMAEAHLRLAALYNAKGMKDKVVAEYEAFLKQRPDYPDRKKLEAFIASTKTQ